MLQAGTGLFATCGDVRSARWICAMHHWGVLGESPGCPARTSERALFKSSSALVEKQRKTCVAFFVPSLVPTGQGGVL